MHYEGTDYERLADRAERGELSLGRTIHTGNGSPVDLEQMFIPTGRPRMDEPVAARTWKVRAAESLDATASAQARREGIPKSALIRKAVVHYLNEAATAQ